MRYLAAEIVAASEPAGEMQAGTVIKRKHRSKLKKYIERIISEKIIYADNTAQADTGTRLKTHAGAVIKRQFSFLRFGESLVVVPEVVDVNVGLVFFHDGKNTGNCVDGVQPVFYVNTGGAADNNTCAERPCDGMD